MTLVPKLHRWLTVDQAAEFMQLDIETIRRWIRSKKLPATKIGGSYRIDINTLEEIMEGKRA